MNRDRAGRKALLKSLSGSLIEEEKIVTTKAKARALKPHIEKLITKAKDKNLANERHLLKFLSKPAVHKLISEIAIRYKDRNGGYSRLIKIGKRHHDKAEMAILELVK